MRPIEHRLREIIEDHLDVPPDRIRLDSRFIEDLGADSLDAVELAMAVEEEFNINVPDHVLPGDMDGASFGPPTARPTK